MKKACVWGGCNGSRDDDGPCDRCGTRAPGSHKPDIGTTWVEIGKGGILRVASVRTTQVAGRSWTDVVCDLIGETDGVQFGTISIPLDRWTPSRVRPVLRAPEVTS
jgi:hypothetical protein